MGNLFKKSKSTGKFKKRKFILEHDRIVYSKDISKKGTDFLNMNANIRKIL